MQDNVELIWHGALFGLFLIAAFGVFLFGRRERIRAALAPYVGEEPARWLLYLLAFGYVYSSLNAVSQAMSHVPMFAPEMGMPTVLAFMQGAVWHALMNFMHAFVSIVHAATLLLVGLVLYRAPKARPA
jgi:hypothetical protein